MDYDRRDALFYAAMSAIMLAILLYVPIADPKHIKGQLFLGFSFILMPIAMAYIFNWGE